jgi:hypothetical protein
VSETTRPQTVDTKWPINKGQLAQQLVVYRCTDYMRDFAASIDQARMTDGF